MKTLEKKPKRKSLMNFSPADEPSEPVEGPGKKRKRQPWETSKGTLSSRGKLSPGGHEMQNILFTTPHLVQPKLAIILSVGFKIMQGGGGHGHH